MYRLGKYLSLCLVAILAVSSLIVIQSAYAQSTPQKPTAPEFTLTFHPASETITHVDSFTGAKTYEILDKSTIEVKIKNQPFEESIDGVKYYLFYMIFVSGHFDPLNQKDWRYCYNFPDNYTGTSSGQKILEATETEYTTASIDGDFPTDAQIDVYVSAMLMHDGQFRAYNYIFDLTGYLVSGVVQGETNGNTQTFAIPEHLTSSVESPNPTSIRNTPPISVMPNTPECSSTPAGASGLVGDIISMPLVTFAAVIATFLAVIIILLGLIFFRKHKQNPV